MYGVAGALGTIWMVVYRGCIEAGAGLDLAAAMVLAWS